MPARQSSDAIFAKFLQLASGQQPKKHRAECLSLLRLGASRNHPKSLYVLGNWHLYGAGVRKNYRVAADFFERAAMLGDRDAQYDLAISYERGKGRPKDLAKAFRWYERAARAGDSQAQAELARCLFYGIGVSRNWSAATRWYQKAARSGHREAQYALGRAYEFGEGRRSNFHQALRWYKEAAKQGDRSALKAIRDLKKTVSTQKNTSKRN